MSSVRGRAGQGQTEQGRTRRARGLVALLVLGALVLGGALSACTGRPGAAAVVDGRTISVDEVQVATRELTPFYQGVEPATVLQVLIQEPVVTQYASEQGVGISDEQAQEALTELVSRISNETDVAFSPASIAVERYLLASAALGGVPDQQAALADLQARFAAQQVEVSPRFGQLTADGTITQVVDPWIVSPASS